MGEGINSLAAALAYWVSHPWYVIGMYLTFVALKTITVKFWGVVLDGVIDAATKERSLAEIEKLREDVRNRTDPRCH